MDLRCLADRYSVACILLGTLLSVSGCGHGAKLVQETPSGGVVTYPYKEKRGGVSGIVEGTEDEVTYKRWGLQFQCKSV